MKKSACLCILVSLCLIILTVFSGCGDDGGGSSGTTPATLYDVTGTWYLAIPGSGNLVMYLVQDAQGTITGTVDRSSQTSAANDSGTIRSGSNVNNKVNIHFVFGDSHHFILEGDVLDVNTMEGTSQNYYDPQERIYESPWGATRAQ